MATVKNNRQSYNPQIDPSIDPKVTRHLQNLYGAINDHDQAIVAVNAKATSSASSTTTNTTTIVNESGLNTTAGVSSFNALTGAITFFASLGLVNNQSGVTAYTTQTQDNG